MGTWVFYIKKLSHFKIFYIRFFILYFPFIFNIPMLAKNKFTCPKPTKPETTIICGSHEELRRNQAPYYSVAANYNTAPPFIQSHNVLLCKKQKQAIVLFMMQ